MTDFELIVLGAAGVACFALAIAFLQAGNRALLRRAMGVRAARRVKPPRGLRPRAVANRQRMTEIREAILRYSEVGKPVPDEWFHELAELEAGEMLITQQFADAFKRLGILPTRGES